MNYYRDYRCELRFDSVTGQLHIYADPEVQPFVQETLRPERLLNLPFTRYAKVVDVHYNERRDLPSLEWIQPAIDPNMLSSSAPVKEEYLSSDGEYCSSYTESVTSEDIDPFLNVPNSALASSASSALASPALASPALASPASAGAAGAVGAEILSTDPASTYFGIRGMLSDLQQLECKALSKLLIRKAIPAKKRRYPYKTGELSRPEMWPAGVPHRQPDHISKTERLDLLYHFLTMMPFEDVLVVCNLFKASLSRGKRVVIERILASLAMI